MTIMALIARVLCGQRLYVTNTDLYVGLESICLIKTPYPKSMHLLPVNWTTATAYYMAFLLFTLKNFKEFKMLLPDL